MDIVLECYRGVSSGSVEADTFSRVAGVLRTNENENREVLLKDNLRDDGKVAS